MRTFLVTENDCCFVVIGGREGFTRFCRLKDKTNYDRGLCSSESDEDKKHSCPIKGRGINVQIEE